jgi:retron-type reverse transcriptase
MKNKVEISKHGHLLKVTADPEVLVPLTSVLCAEIYHAQESFRFGVTLESKTSPFWWPAFDEVDIWDEPKAQPNVPPAITVLAGLEGLVVSALKELQVSVSFIEAGSVGKLEPSTGQQDFVEALNFIQDCQRGTIRFIRSHKTQLKFLLATIRAWPSARILIASHCKKDAEMLHRALHELRIKFGYSIGNWESSDKRSDRVVLSTFEGIGSGVVDGRSIDIAIFLQPSRLPSNRFFHEILRELSYSRVFALQVDDAVLTESQEFAMEAVFGFRRVAARLGNGRVVNCKFVKLEGLRPKPPGRTPYETHRNLYESHSARNRKICRFADSLTGRNSLRKNGEQISISRVVIVSATSKQARRLRQMLAKDSSVEVATLAQIESQKPNDADVIVRADGTRSPLVSHTSSLWGQESSEPLQIYDFFDDFHSIAKHNAQVRTAGYLELGWGVENGPKPIYEKTKNSRARELFVPYAPTIISFGPSTAGISRSEPEFQYTARRRRHRRVQKAKRRKGAIDLSEIDRELLYDAFRRLRREGGVAPGVDGISSLDVSPSDMGNALEALAEAVNHQVWSPQPTRKIKIPKPGTHDFRTLQLPVLIDRVLYRALFDLISPEFDPQFLTNSFGFRPRRSSMGMLATIASQAGQAGHGWLVNCDVRNAFDSVRISDVIESHQLAFSGSLSEDMYALIGSALRGYERAEIGIPQGNSYSPFALNLLLHFAHDTKLPELGVTPFWFRYADNLVYLNESENEGEQVVSKISSAISSVDLELKPNWELVNIFEGQTELLGLQLSGLHGTTTFQPLPDFETKLAKSLSRCWDHPNPNRAGLNVLAQWAAQHAPTFDNGRGAGYLKRAIRLSHDHGLELTISLVESYFAEASDRWRKAMDRARRAVGGGR